MGILMFPAFIKRNIIIPLLPSFIHGIYFGLNETETDNLKCYFVIKSRLRIGILSGCAAVHLLIRITAIWLFLQLKVLAVKCFMWNVHQDDRVWVRTGITVFCKENNPTNLLFSWDSFVFQNSRFILAFKHFQRQ